MPPRRCDHLTVCRFCLSPNGKHAHQTLFSSEPRLGAARPVKVATTGRALRGLLDGLVKRDGGTDALERVLRPF